VNATIKAQTTLNTHAHHKRALKRLRTDLSVISPFLFYSRHQGKTRDSEFHPHIHIDLFAAIAVIISFHPTMNARSPLSALLVSVSNANAPVEAPLSIPLIISLITASDIALYTILHRYPALMRVRTETADGGDGNSTRCGA
jgi:hypothetical protein